MEIEEIFKGRTFKDFLLRLKHGVLEHRGDAILTMPLSRHINIAVPIVGANMDTVTREKMMKTLSVEGCFGFLDRNCSIEDEAARVRWVKSQQSYLIDNPCVIHKDATVGEAKKLMKKRGISGVLVEEKPESKILAGIFTQRNIPADESKKVAGYMTPYDKLIIAQEGISLEEAERLMFENSKEKLPIVDKSRMFIRGLITMKDLRKAKQKPYSTKDARGRLLVGAAIGAVGDYMERAEALVEAETDCVLIDIAHGDSEIMRKAVVTFKAKFPDVELACGNVGTGEGAKFLADLGVDAIKVGIGPGRGCRTRLETRFGVAQLQAVREAYLAVGDKVPIIADGGIKDDGDVAMAIIAAGASTVMIGSELAGTDEAPGAVIDDPEKKRKVKIYRGMTSPQAVLDGSVRDTDDVLKTMRAPEGQQKPVDYTGSAADIINRIKEHVQSAVSQAGTRNLWDARHKFAFGICLNPGDFLNVLSDAAREESFDR